MNTELPNASTLLNDELVPLMARIQERDEQAFSELSHLVEGVLFATIYKVLNNPDDAQDVCQEVLVKLWQRPDLYDQQRGKPLTWLRTLARNRAIDRFRSKQRRSALNERFHEEVDTTHDKVSCPLTDTVESNESSVAVREAVIKLTPEQKRVVELAYFSGLTQSEIAQKLGEPLGTVKARIRRGVRSLRGTLQREDFR